MAASNAVEWFEEEQERSPRVLRFHYYMNMAFKFATFTAGAVAIYAIYLSASQHHDIYKNASQIVKPVEKQYATVSLNEDGSVSVREGDKELFHITEGIHSRPGFSHGKTRAQKALLYFKSSPQPLKDYGYYSQHLKPELRSSLPELYKAIMNPKVKIKDQSLLGTEFRTNHSRQVERIRDINS